ncbi:hypothetical protein [Achromobacter sp. DMS1]|uniref:hypothetical protein n=1 Tax=Achromobacter sp. DMS1 TaxID=1688405 RepID=UPI001F2EB7E2|nr:hypothetical protein [Achromobacter sp. DMS1]
MADEQGLEHFLLAGKMRVHAALGKAGPLRDGVHAGAGIARRRELQQRRIQYLPDPHGRRQPPPLHLHNVSLWR